MRKVLRKSRTTKWAFLAGVSVLVLMMSACSSPQILQDNGDIPAPSLIPPPDANQLASPGQVEEFVPTPTETVQIASPVTQTAPISQVKYVVKKGDSLWRVAKMFDVSVNELAAFNNIDNKSLLKVGQTLQIPPAGLAEPRSISAPAPSEKAVKPVSKSSASASGSIYIVKSGDSLWAIAKKNHISTKKLAEANGLGDQASLRVGQKLMIPSGKTSTPVAVKAVADKKTPKPEVAPVPAVPIAQAPNQMNGLASNTSQEPAVDAKAATSATATASETAAVPASAANYLPHTVKDGDTWQTISDMYGVSLEDLKKANPSIAGDTQPKTGTVVNIPEE